MDQEKIKNDQKNRLLQYAMNPRAFTMKKWLMDLLKEKYAPHDDMVERISFSLLTDKDLDDFGKLIVAVYESAYLRAVTDYKEQAEKLGLKINIVDQPVS